jgi:hypothetical protein
MKINKAKLKIWIPAIVGVLLIVLIIPIKPLSFFGISKCGRVWNQVEVGERLVTYLIRSHPGSYEIEIDFKSTDYIFYKFLPDDIKNIWALGTNNPRCFSETQRIYIQKIGEPEFINTVAKELIRSIRVNGSFQGTGAGSVTVRLGKYVSISQN